MSRDDFISFLKRYRGIIAVYLAMMLTVLDGTIVNVALPTLTHLFGSHAASTVWIVNAYQLVITMLLLTCASLGDIFGYKKVYLIGIVLFTLSSGLCAASQSLWMLIAFRVVQGIGAACIMSVNIAMVRMIFPADKIGRGMGVNAMVVSFSTVIGPTLAGSILAITSWHWLFLINLPIGLAAFVIGKKFLPEHELNSNKKFDWISALMCAAFFGLLINGVEGFSRASADWKAICIKFLLVIALAILVVRRQRDRQDPLLPVDLFKIKIFSMSVCTSVASFCAQMLAMVSLPFLLQDVLGYDPLQVGLLMSPWAIGVMIAAPIAGRVVERVHAGLLGAIGMSICALGLFTLYLLPSDASTFQIIWRMLICGLGFGTFQTPNNVTMASSTPMRRSGAVGGMQSSARVLGQTLGTTFVAIIFAIYSPIKGSNASLLAAIGVAIVAAIGSSLRLTQPFTYKKQK